MFHPSLIPITESHGYNIVPNGWMALYVVRGLLNSLEIILVSWYTWEKSNRLHARNYRGGFKLIEIAGHVLLVCGNLNGHYYLLTI